MDLVNYNEERFRVGSLPACQPPGILLGLAEHCLKAGLLAPGRISSREAFFLRAKPGHTS